MTGTVYPYQLFYCFDHRSASTGSEVRRLRPPRCFYSDKVNFFLTILESRIFSHDLNARVLRNRVTHHCTGCRHLGNKARVRFCFNFHGKGCFHESLQRFFDLMSNSKSFNVHLLSQH